jgi:hypothetical protein
MDEIDVLARHKIPFARTAPTGGIVAATYFLSASGCDAAFFLGPPGQRTDFRLLARLLDFPHLSLASRVEAEVFFGQPPGRLTPMALAFYEFDRFPVVAASALMNAPALGFAIGGGTRVWLSPDALCELVAALGFSFQILDNANEIPEMALSHPEDSRGSATRRSPTSS